MRTKTYAIPSIVILFIILIISTHPNTTDYWLQYWWMLPIALIIALIVNTVGISGAALFVPFFILIFPLLATPLAPEQSVKLGLITEAFGLTSSALAFMRYGLVDKKLGMQTALWAIPFVIAGGMLSYWLPKRALYIIIASALLISTYLMTSKKRKELKIEYISKNKTGTRHAKTHDNITTRALDGKTYIYCRSCGNKKRKLGYSIGGIFQGMAGFGIGELGIISMISTKIPLRIAIGTSHIIVAATAIIASITHILQSAITNTPTPWNIIIMTVPAVTISGQIAPYTAARLKNSMLELIITILFITIATALIFLAV